MAGALGVGRQRGRESGERRLLALGDKFLASPLVRTARENLRRKKEAHRRY